MLLLAEMIENYTIIVNEQNNRFKFLVSDLPLEKFSFFIQKYLEPPLDEIKQYYNMIQNELLNKISEIINQMKDFSEEIKIKYNITEQMNTMFNVLKNTYDNLVNYTQNFVDDIDEYDDILVLYTYISGSTHTIRQLNEYLEDNNEEDINEILNSFNFTNNKSRNKKVKRTTANRTKNNNISKIYNNNLNNHIKVNNNKNGFNSTKTVKNKKKI